MQSERISAQAGELVQLVRGIYVARDVDADAAILGHAIRIAHYLYPAAYLSSASAARADARRSPLHQRPPQSAHPAAQFGDRPERSSDASLDRNGRDWRRSGRAAHRRILTPTALSGSLSASQRARQRRHCRDARADGRASRRGVWRLQGCSRCGLGVGARERLVS